MRPGKQRYPWTYLRGTIPKQRISLPDYVGFMVKQQPDRRLVIKVNAVSCCLLQVGHRLYPFIRNADGCTRKDYLRTVFDNGFSEGIATFRVSRKPSGRVMKQLALVCRGMVMTPQPKVDGGKYYLISIVLP